MKEILRQVDFHNAETVLLVCCLLLLAITKTRDEQRFNSFIGLFVSYRYLKIYSKEQENIHNTFNITLFLSQLLSFTLLLNICIQHFQLSSKYPIWAVFGFLALFILFKYYLEKIIATIFDVPEFLESFQFHKLTYRNLIAVVLLPLISLYLYSIFSKNALLYIMLFLFIFLNITALFLTIRNHQNLIKRYFFYFILYLCALEIAPYLILFKTVFR